MGSGKAMGFIESVGLASAIAAADAALKAANVQLVGRENSRGSGYITIKIVGDVGAVKAAIDVAKAVSSKVNQVWSVDVIPRPGTGLGDALVWNTETMGVDEWLSSEGKGTSSNLPAVKENSPLANRPAHAIVAVEEDIPKPAIIVPETSIVGEHPKPEDDGPDDDNPPTDTDRASQDTDDTTTPSAPDKKPTTKKTPRRKPGGHGRKPK
jgi:microcompartment protein CcmL/EutN